MTLRFWENLFKPAQSQQARLSGLLPFQPLQRPASSYDMVLLGSGIETVLTAYVLARHFGQKNIAVLSTAGFYETAGDELLTAHHLCPATAPLFKLSQTLVKQFAKHFPATIKPVRQPCLTLITSDSGMRKAVDQTHILAALGLSGWIISPRETHIHAPLLALRSETQGAMLVPDSAVINRQAFYYACLQEAQTLGVSFIPHCPVERLLKEQDQICGLETAKGTIRTARVIGTTQTQAFLAADRSLPACSALACREWMALPIRAPLKPAIVSPQDHMQILYSKSGVFTFRDFDPAASPAITADKILKLFPDLSQQNIHTHHTRTAHLTADGLPLIGHTAVEGLYVLDGMGWNRLSLAFGAAVALASTVTTRALHPALRPFQRLENAA